MSYRALSPWLALALLGLLALTVGCGTSRRGRVPLPDTGTGTDSAVPPTDSAVPTDTGAPPPTDSAVPTDTSTPPECTVDSDCDDGVVCTVDRCASGACTRTPDDALCETGMTCDPARGCTGMACDESPCRLIAPQCGCPASQACYYDEATMSRSCETPGTLVQGRACTAQSQCAPGHICGGNGVAQCYEVCVDDFDCPGRARCLIGFADVEVCTDICDPITQTGCSPGVACQVGTVPSSAAPVTLCNNRAGTGTQDDTCADSNDCAAGYICGGFCARWCRVGVSSDCPVSYTCTGFADDLLVDGTFYNVCLAS